MHDQVNRDWQVLHGYPLPDAARRVLVDPAGELAAYRAADFLDRGNVVEAAIQASTAGHRLALWEPFVSVLPSRSLGNGDILFTYVPSPIYDPTSVALLVWNHERDHFDRASDDDLAEVGHPGPPGDPAKALSFVGRGAYLVELLARGRFDLGAYLAYEHLPLADTAAFRANVAASPPTGVYALWHLFFAGPAAALPPILEAARHSPARWTRDSAALIDELLAGRTQLGPIADVQALRAEVAAVASDPATTARVAAARWRAQVEQQLARVGPATLIRDDAAAAPCPGVAAARLGDLDLEVLEARPHQHRLVLRRDGRALDAMPLAGVGGTPDHAPVFEVVRDAPAPLVALWRPYDPARPQVMGAVALVAVVEGRLVHVCEWPLDVHHLETRDGALVARTADGAGYRLAGLDAVRPAAPAPPRLPGRVASPPASSPPPELDGDRLELTPTSLQLWRGKRMLFEEPLPEAYAMTVLPARRMVAVYGTSFEHRPIVDVLYVRSLQRKVKAGQGCCSWVSLAVDGCDVQLASTDDRLYVHDGRDWIEIDDEPLTSVPSWIRNRGWVS